MPPSVAESMEHAQARVLPASGLIELVRGVVASGGSLWVRVTGISMNPVLREGDSVLLAPPRRRLRRGDVVFLDFRGRPLLHRVQTNAAGMLVTRGDATCRDDEPVPSDACVAQAVAARRGTTILALTLTLRVGIKPLLWLVAWKIRTGLPPSVARTVTPLSRAIRRAIS